MIPSSRSSKFEHEFAYQIEGMMADWGRTLEDLLDGITLRQFRLLAEMRERRIIQSRRWDLTIASLNVQSESQLEAVNELIEQYSLIEDGEEPVATMGGGFTASKRYPLLHEVTPGMATAMRLPIQFVDIPKDEDA